MVGSIEAEVARLRALLDAAIRLKAQTHRSVERKLGWSTSYLNKLIRGVSELHADHILAVLKALEIEPAAFFRVAFPDPGRPRVEADRAAAALQAEIERGQAAGGLFGMPSPDRVATAGELLLRAVATLVPEWADAVGGRTPSPEAPRKAGVKAKRPPRRQPARSGGR